MASETSTDGERVTASRGGDWWAGLVGGLAGALSFAGLLLAASPATIKSEVPALVLVPGPNVVVGVAIHLAVGALLGVVYAVFVGMAGLQREPAPQQVSTGLIYGLATWAVLGAVLTPYWLEAVGYLQAPVVPRIDVVALVGHAVYGAILGSVHYALEEP